MRSGNALNVICILLGMVFLLNYIYSVVYTYLLGREYSHYHLTNSGLFFLLLPLLLLWLIISGGQDSVGTDYESYMYIFEGNQLDYFKGKHEYLFVAIVSLCNVIGIYGQALFYVFYGIIFYFLFLILKRFPLKQIFIFIVLYITVTSLFNNQLNTLRQATAIYIGTYASLLVFERKNLKAFLFMLIASLIHQSAIILLLIFCLRYISGKLSTKALLFCLLGAFLLSLFLQVESIKFLIPFLPEDYAWHILGGGVGEGELLNKLTKYIFIPIYLLSLYYTVKHKCTIGETLLFKVGWIAFCFRLSVINLTIVSRITDYFLLLSVFPLILYLYRLFERNQYFLFVSICFFLSIFYSLKVTFFARGEYLYNSIYY